MRIALCDDEEQELNRLANLLSNYQTKRGTTIECRTFNNGMDFLYSLKGGEYDVVILDVMMPGFNGLQTAQELRTMDKNVKIIFVTSSPDFALESYSVNAHHYLMKPATLQNLYPVLDQIQVELSLSDDGSLLLRDREGVVRVLFSRLEYIEVMNKTVFFHLSDGNIKETTGALADFEEELLSQPQFLKVHRSYLINLRYVQSINAQSAVTYLGHTIPISRSMYSHVKDVYINFLFQSKTTSNPLPAPTIPTVTPPIKKVDGPWQFLLVDDDPIDLSIWAGTLLSHGCVVHTASNGAEALQTIVYTVYDCIVLDVMLPGEDGFSLCGQLRKFTNAPIVFLSCSTEIEKQLLGFSSGGVDYITKDTPSDLFWAKIETRVKLSRSDQTQLQFGLLLMDLTLRKAFLGKEELVLTPTEFELLWLLSEHAEHIYTPDELYRKIWGATQWESGQTIQVHMSRLRRKLEKACPQHLFIETVWGQGYRFSTMNLQLDKEGAQ